MIGDKDNKTLYSDLSTGNSSEERPGWPPFSELFAYSHTHTHIHTHTHTHTQSKDGPNCKTLIGAVDYAWLFTYAVFLVCRLVKKIHKYTKLMYDSSVHITQRHVYVDGSADIDA